MISFLTIGTVLGLSAGFAPGPLLALVISETIQHNIKSGVKVACSPIITDLPIIIFAMLILSKLSGFHSVLGLISILGGFFLMFMGFKNITTKGVKIDLEEIRPSSLAKGVLANILSPHPYLFWLSVGAPILTNAISQNIISALAFILGFYAFLIGSKIMLAILVGRSKSLLTGNAYIYTMRFLGLILCIFGIILFKDGFILLGIV